MSFTKEKQLAIQTAKTAGTILLTSFRKTSPPRMFRKSKYDIVTSADFAAEKIIVSAIKKNFPRHDILGEESGFIDKSSSDYLWVVDPLDGTTNFAMKNPIFCVSIGLLYKDEPVVGVIYAPVTDELFVAQKGKGATVNGKKIHVSRSRKLSSSIVTYCVSPAPASLRDTVRRYRTLKPIVRDFRRFGAAAFELAYVAAGRTDAHVINHPILLWDVCAGAVLVREAGGEVLDFSGRQWSIKSKNIVASNKKITKELLRYL